MQKSSPDDAESRRARFEQGRAMLESLGGETILSSAETLGETAPELAHQMVAWAFGELYSRPTLAPRDRQLLTLGILTSLGGSERQLTLHIHLAMKVGLTPEEIVEALLHSAIYCGFPRAINAVAVAREVFDRAR